jgi:hypothetical protein
MLTVAALYTLCKQKYFVYTYDNSSNCYICYHYLSVLKMGAGTQIKASIFY